MTPDTIANDVVVTLSYNLSLDDGTTVEFSDETDPLVYLHGHQNIIPGLERALTGLKVGDRKGVVVQPDEGYGDYDPEDTQELGRDEMPADFVPEEGMLLEVHDEDGEELLATVIEVADDHVVLDFNHPMAGKTLHFDVNILSLRDASPDELAHGHVHDDDHMH